MLEHNKKRDITFDIMKGIGILLVITCHFYGWNHPVFSRVIRSFHMPMFFLVAGYFSKSFTDWKRALLQERCFFLRYCFPMALTQLLIVLWAIWMAFVGKGEWNVPVKETLSLFWADVDGPVTKWGKLSLGVIWFLMALFIAKSLLLLFISRLSNWAIPISMTIAVVSLLLHKFFPYSIWCISLGMVALPFVTIGWWVKNHSVPSWVKWVAMGCWVAAIFFSELDMYSYTWKCYPLDLVGACGGTYCLFLISRVIEKRLIHVGRVFAYIGMISLAIMCMHCFELASHMGNHIIVLVGIVLPDWGVFVWRYIFTIGLAIVLVHIPLIKRIFM